VRVCRFYLPGAAAAALLSLATIAIAGESSDAAVSVLESTMVGMDDATTTGASVSELQFAFAYSEARRTFQDDGTTAEIPENSLRTGTVFYTYGLTPRLDLSLLAFGIHYRDEDEPDPTGREFGDLFADVKWRFCGDGVRGIQLAYRPGLLIPFGEDDDGGDQAPGMGSWAARQALIATLLQRNWMLDLEISVLFPIDDRSGQDRLHNVSFGAGYQISKTVKPLIELQYVHDVLDGEPDGKVLAVTAGATVNATNSIRLDLGLRRGVWGRNVDQRLAGSVNLSFTFGRPRES